MLLVSHDAEVRKAYETRTILPNMRSWLEVYSRTEESARHSFSVQQMWSGDVTVACRIILLTNAVHPPLFATRA